MLFQIKKKGFFLYWFFPPDDDDWIFCISLINNNEVDVIIYINKKYKTYFILVYLQVYDHMILSFKNLIFWKKQHVFY